MISKFDVSQMQNLAQPINLNSDQINYRFVDLVFPILVCCQTNLKSCFSKRLSWMAYLANLLQLKILPTTKKVYEKTT